MRGLPASGNHARAIYTTLATVLNSAVADKLIPSSPCHEANIKRARPKPASRKTVPWTAGQVEAVREALPASDRILVDLGAWLGLRQGEIFGLAVEDLDFLRKVVHVRRQVRIVRTRLVFALPKGGKERDILMPDTVALALAAHLAGHPAAPVTLAWEEPGGKAVTAALVLRSPTGLAINRNSFNPHVWKPTLQRRASRPCGRTAATPCGTTSPACCCSVGWTCGR